MEFKTSLGYIMFENDIQKMVFLVVKSLKHDGDAFLNKGMKEFLEWFLNKTIKKGTIQLYEDITEEDLEQLEQLRNYLEL